MLSQLCAGAWCLRNTINPIVWSSHLLSRHPGLLPVLRAHTFLLSIRLKLLINVLWIDRWEHVHSSSDLTS